MATQKQKRAFQKSSNETPSFDWRRGSTALLKRAAVTALCPSITAKERLLPANPAAERGIPTTAFTTALFIETVTHLSIEILCFLEGSFLTFLDGRSQ